MRGLNSRPSHWAYIKTAFNSTAAAVCKSHCSSKLWLTFFSQTPATVGAFAPLSINGQLFILQLYTHLQVQSFLISTPRSELSFTDNIYNILLLRSTRLKYKTSAIQANIVCEIVKSRKKKRERNPGLQMPGGLQKLLFFFRKDGKSFGKKNLISDEKREHLLFKAQPRLH